MSSSKTAPVLLFSVFIIAICGLLYELLISSISAYFLGSSILHFSLTIGFFLTFMGIGAFFSKFLKDEKLLTAFIQIEILLGFIGGASGVVLYATYALTENYYLIAFILIGSIGTLVGLEIPILTRIIRDFFNLKDTLAQVLSFDYLGALIASIIFPFLLLPYLGLTRTAFFVGLLNLAVGIFNLWVFREQVQSFLRQVTLTSFLVVLYAVGFYYAYGISGYLEQFLYQDDIVLSRQSAYQRIVMTRWNRDIRLYLNGHLQFSSLDEHRYHESLVHIPMALTPRPEKILLLGAGDGLATRELLKYPEIQEIHVVDLDSVVTNLGKDAFIFQHLNQNALNDPKVKIFNRDAYKFIEKTNNFYSLIIIDLPDPNDINLGKLYSQEFYHLCQKRLAKDGVLVTQSTSPFFAKNAFWCIHHTLEAVFPQVEAFTVNIPSFGQWGFNMVLNYQVSHPINKVQEKLITESKLRFLTKKLIPKFFLFDADMAETSTEINKLETLKLVQYYEQDWRLYNGR